jgi:hypothetical protein
LVFRPIPQLLQGLLENNKNQKSSWNENLLVRQTRRASPLSPKYFLGIVIVRVLSPAHLFPQPPAAPAASVSNAHGFEFDRPFLLKTPIVMS